MSFPRTNSQWSCSVCALFAITTLHTPLTVGYFVVIEGDNDAKTLENDPALPKDGISVNFIVDRGKQTLNLVGSRRVKGSE